MLLDGKGGIRRKGTNCCSCHLLFKSFQLFVPLQLPPRGLGIWLLHWDRKAQFSLEKKQCFFNL